MTQTMDQLKTDAQLVHAILDKLDRDLEAYSFGELRSRIDEATKAAADVLDAIADVENEAEAQAVEVLDAAAFASYVAGPGERPSPTPAELDEMPF